MTSLSFHGSRDNLKSLVAHMSITWSEGKGSSKILIGKKVGWSLNFYHSTHRIKLFKKNKISRGKRAEVKKVAKNEIEQFKNLIKSFGEKEKNRCKKCVLVEQPTSPLETRTKKSRINSPPDPSQMNSSIDLVQLMYKDKNIDQADGVAPTAPIVVIFLPPYPPI